MTDDRDAGADPGGVEVRDGLDDNQLAALRRLLADADSTDGTPSLNEQALLGIKSGAETDARHLLAVDSAVDPAGTARLVGYAHLGPTGGPADAATAELVVHPEHRRRGWGELLARKVLELSVPHPLLAWSHGAHRGAARLASRLGFVRVRDLWQLRRDLAEPLAAPTLPDDLRLRTFVVGADEPAWLELNARAFANHSEQGGLTGADLARRLAADWFDTAGFFLAERDGRLVGFHWTKVHPATGTAPAVGEVYVLGVDPVEQGSGLGRALTVAGLQHLRERGLGEVLLYVEADNLPALRVYEQLGFAHVATDTQYRHPGSSR